MKGETRFKRSSKEAYRGRAAMGGGGNGLYFFNLYDIDRESPLWRELGDPFALSTTTKHFFITDVDGPPNAGWPAASSTRSCCRSSPPGGHWP